MDCTYGPSDIDPLFFGAPPIGRLSPEIFSEIFIDCLPYVRGKPFDASDRLPIMNERDAPLILGRVCRTWRSVSQGTPQLWAALQLGDPEEPNDPLNPTQDLRRDARALKTCLARSGACDLYFDFRYAKLRDGEAAQYTDILRLIVPHYRRWKYIHLTDLPTFVSWPAIQVIIACAAPRLEYLVAMAKEDRPNPSGDLDEPVWEELEKSLRFGVFDMHRIQVLELSTVEMTYNACVICLMSCYFLDTFYAIIDNTPRIIPDEMIEIGERQSLTSLSLFSEAHDLGPILDKMTTPNLTVLQLAHHFPNTTTGGWPHLDGFLNRIQQRRLEVLELTNLPMLPTDVFTIIMNTPSIETLALMSMELPDGFLNILTPHPPGSFPNLPMLPNLQDVIIRDSGLLHAESLTAFIWSRWKCTCKEESASEKPACRSLHRVRVCGWDIIYSSGSLNIDECIRQGFTFDVQEV